MEIWKSKSGKDNTELVDINSVHYFKRYNVLAIQTKLVLGTKLLFSLISRLTYISSNGNPGNMVQL